QVKALAFELLVKGKLNSLQDLSLFNLYIKKNKNRVINMVEISKKLQHEIIANIYLQLAAQSKGLICTSYRTGFECLFEELNLHSPLVRNLSSKYNVSFSPSSKSLMLENFKIELKIIKTDETELSSMGLGLDKLSAQATDILNNSTPNALLGGNHILLSEQQLNSKVVSQPSILTTIGQTSQVQLGADIPITNKSEFGTTTSWKFAGLQLKAKLDLDQSKLKLALESELTYPVDALIRGSKSKSEFFPKMDRFIQAFQVRYDIKSTNLQTIPGLGDVPILKNLFSSNSSQSTTQWLIGYVKITRIK
ncbi:MAG: hypothetical protein KC478_08390, partial [Bacteriovoracaceae bacterium]|nr:hypothetical protein [Bacteriovoracaceae bacterium]